MLKFLSHSQFAVLLATFGSRVFEHQEFLFSFTCITWKYYISCIIGHILPPKTITKSLSLSLSLSLTHTHTHTHTHYIRTCFTLAHLHPLVFHLFTICLGTPYKSLKIWVSHNDRMARKLLYLFVRMHSLNTRIIKNYASSSSHFV